MAGTLATAVGMAGRLIMVLVDGPAAPHRNTVPEFALDVVLRPGTVATVIVLGIGAVAAAPFLTVRRMDLPGTLRLVEGSLPMAPYSQPRRLLIVRQITISSVLNGLLELRPPARST